MVHKKIVYYFTMTPRTWSPISSSASKSLLQQRWRLVSSIGNRSNDTTDYDWRRRHVLQYVSMVSLKFIANQQHQSSSFQKKECRENLNYVLDISQSHERKMVSINQYVSFFQRLINNFFWFQFRFSLIFMKKLPVFYKQEMYGNSKNPDSCAKL